MARATVESAYAQLIAEGFCRAGAGRHLCLAAVAAHAGAASVAPPLPAVAPDPLQPQGMLQPFQLGVPALDAFPRALWQRIVARQLRGSTVASSALPPAGGLPELREAIAHYLHLSRGISCQPEQIFLCAGYPALLDWVVETLLHAGDAVWIEDPGYPVTRPLLRAAGVSRSPCRWMNRAWTWPPVS